MGLNISYLTFQVLDYALAVFMYTLLGRVLLGMFLEPDSGNYIWRFFCLITDPVVAAVAVVTPRVAPPVILWLFAVVWLFWLRAGLLFGFRLAGAVPGIG